MSLFSLLFRASPRYIVLASLTGLVAGVSNTSLIAVANLALTTGGSSFSSPTLIWGFVGLCLVLLISKIASQVLLIRLSQGTIYNLRMRLCRRILGVPLRQLEEVGSPRLLAALTDDIQTITQVLQVFHLICINSAILIGCMIYLIWLSWPVFVAVILFLVTGSVLYSLLARGTVRSLTQARDEQDSMYKHFRALLEGAKELKLHARRRQAFLSDALEPTAQSYRRHNVTGLTIFAVVATWGQLLFFVLMGLLLFALPRAREVTPEVLTGYVLTLLFMMSPLETFLSILPVISRGNVAYKKVATLGMSLEAEGAGEDPVLAPAGKPALRSLDLVAVSHEYHNENENEVWTLGPLDLHLEPGEIVFLIGGNGSGKTTLAKLIAGLYTPKSGEIRLDGQPITDRNREHYRQFFSVVFSDFFLFEQLLGLDAPGGDDLARQYLVRLGLDHKVRIEGNRLSTTELSHGQRKRLALLTAYLEDRPFYVFDEWAADQDPAFKEIFYHRLLPELRARGKAALIISHDEHYYDAADRIVKLDYGRVESDTRTGDRRTTELQVGGSPRQP